MTEDNFVDYVKINVKSGDGGKGSTHLRRENLLQREVQTEEMAAEEVILFLSLTKTCGHFIILNLKNTSKLKMGEMVVNRGAQIKWYGSRIKVPVGTVVKIVKQMKLFLNLSMMVIKKL